MEGVTHETLRGELEKEGDSGKGERLWSLDEMLEWIRR